MPQKEQDEDGGRPAIKTNECPGWASQNPAAHGVDLCCVVHFSNNTVAYLEKDDLRHANMWFVFCGKGRFMKWHCLCVCVCENQECRHSSEPDVCDVRFCLCMIRGIWQSSFELALFFFTVTALLFSLSHISFPYVLSLFFGLLFSHIYNTEQRINSTLWIQR